MSVNEGKLANFLRRVSNMKWDEFVRAERDPDYSSNEAVIFAVIRSCAMENLAAIKMATNRLDGKLATPIRIEYPKVYYLYPNATLLEGATSPVERLNSGEQLEPEVLSGEIMVMPPPPDEPDLPSMGFRETVRRLSDEPRELPKQVVAWALQTEQWLRDQAPQPATIPSVKAVVASHLLVMAQGRKMDAIEEVFNNIDGKLVETVQILGDDMYINDYSPTAPPDAVLNADGILQIEAKTVTDIWAQRLGKED